MANFKLPDDSDDEHAAHVDAWRSSGSSRRRYAHAHGIHKSTFNGWINKADSGEAQSSLVPVALRKNGYSNKDTSRRVSIECASGVVLQVTPGTPIPWVVELIKAL
jgi:hypothetical protein